MLSQWWLAICHKLVKGLTTAALPARVCPVLSSRTADHVSAQLPFSRARCAHLQLPRRPPSPQACRTSQAGACAAAGTGRCSASQQPAPSLHAQADCECFFGRCRQIVATTVACLCMQLLGSIFKMPAHNAPISVLQHPRKYIGSMTGHGIACHLCCGRGWLPCWEG